MKRQLHLDCDGVLANFDAGADTLVRLKIISRSPSLLEAPRRAP
jgi:hypothetical protein